MLFLAALLIVLALIAYHYWREAVRLINRHFLTLYQRQLRLEACLEVIWAELRPEKKPVIGYEAFDDHISEKLGPPWPEIMGDLEEARQVQKRWLR